MRKLTALDRTYRFFDVLHDWVCGKCVLLLAGNKSIWEVKIDQGVRGMRNMGFPGKQGKIHSIAASCGELNPKRD